MDLQLSAVEIVLKVAGLPGCFFLRGGCEILGGPKICHGTWTVLARTPVLKRLCHGEPFGVGWKLEQEWPKTSGSNLGH